LAVVVEGELQARLGVAGDGEEGVGSVVADGALADELEAELVGVEVETPIEVQDPVAGMHVLHRNSFSAVGFCFSGFY
jgi:hypothetical protein